MDLTDYEFLAIDYYRAAENPWNAVEAARRAGASNEDIDTLQAFIRRFFGSPQERGIAKNETVTLPAVLDVKQTAEYLGVSEDTAYILVHRQDFPAFRIGKCWKIDGRRLGEWVAQQNTK